MVAPACHQPHTNVEIETAMQRYNRLIQKVDADSIAAIYTVDGELGDEVKGRDSIRRFLTKFKDIKVLSQRSATAFISLGSDTAMQKGSYWQTAVLPKGDTVQVSGTFTATWLYTTDGWLIRKMQTRANN